MDLETLWYEAFPYLCGIGGITALLIHGPSILLKGSGILLIAAALTILRLRWTSRRLHFDRMPTAGTPVKRSRAAHTDDE